jgi:lipoate-protein ligase A
MGLESCGLDPKFYGREETLPKGNDCFDFPVTSDLSWKGKKTAGGAQKRSSGVLLHHESIQIPSGVGREELIYAVRQGLGQVFGVEIQNAELDPEIYFQAGKLKETTDCGLQTAV